MFKVRDFAKVKLKNEKRAFKEFEELFSTQIVSDEFILDLVQSYRRNITRYEVEFNFEGNVMEIVYDDYTKFDISKIDNYYQENFARHGSFNKAMFRLKQGGHILSKSYQQLDNRKSMFRIEFSEEIGNGIYFEDIVEYMNYDDSGYFHTIEIYQRMKESIDIAKPSFLIDLGDMLIEFILNLAQHGGRYHNKYITLSNLNLHTSIKVFGNMLVFKGDELVWGDIEEGLDELAYQGYRGIRCNIKPFKREISCEEIQELKKKARYRGLEIIKFGI